MQNRYSGDIGDFSKLGLLRALQVCNIPIGINWYLVPDETHNSDGCHVSYLEKDEFRQCDEVLWHELRKVVHNEKRAVHSLQNKSILTAVHYSEVLDFSGKKRNERDMVRVGWHRQALRQLAQAGIICTDPDNGLIVPSAQGTSRENKYILPEEIQDYYQQGSSVIYYQHKARKPDSFYILQHQALLRNSTFGGAFGQVLKFSTTSQRYYCFVIQPEHYTLIKSALYRMLNGPWSNHFVRKRFT